ncbi:hypothetical protein [Salisaeta longa]|uniref:hypothetical protein n=1 Tax=Salisaeta longa TaxID=503170 RepID=UPI0003B547B8|nr:hypothetical protein [Salisaeta longa]
MTQARTTFFQTLIAFLFLIGGLGSSAAPTAQAQSAKNAIYTEVAGNSLLYSVNYDRRFSDKISGRLGVMTAGASGVSLTAFPLMGNYLLGSGSHRLELGLGPQIFLVSIDGGSGDLAGFDEEGTAIAGTATIGYRYQPMDGGFLFRIGFTPSFSQFGFLPWAGLSLGYAF